MRKVILATTTLLSLHLITNVYAKGHQFYFYNYSGVQVTNFTTNQYIYLNPNNPTTFDANTNINIPSIVNLNYVSPGMLIWEQSNNVQKFMYTYNMVPYEAVSYPWTAAFGTITLQYLNNSYNCFVGLVVGETSLLSHIYPRYIYI